MPRKSIDLDVFRDKPFWCNNTDLDREKTHDCCFNHMIGLPVKAGERHNIYPYEMDVYNACEVSKYVWVKKATGLGITEFFLRYMGWLALRDDQYNGKRFCIITGPNIRLATELISRMHNLFTDTIIGNCNFYHKSTELIVKSTLIQAFPSNHLDAMRGLSNPDVKFVFVDEGDFFRIGEQQNARIVSERYIAKSDPYIVFVSTPNLPGGLFEQMEFEEESRYTRLHLPYTVGLGNIYSQEDITNAMKSASFEREYNLKYGYGTGDVFNPIDIDMAVDLCDFELGYSNDGCVTSIGVDPGFGSSQFAISVVLMEDGLLKVVYCEEFGREGFNKMIDTLFNLKFKYKPSKIYIDAANPEFIKAFKQAIGESVNYEDLIEQARRENIDRSYKMYVVPVNFREEGVEMLTQMQRIVNTHLLAIHPESSQLIKQMMIAKTKDNGQLDKEASTFDALDSVRLALKNFHFK